MDTAKDKNEYYLYESFQECVNIYILNSPDLQHLTKKRIWRLEII